MSSSHVLQTSSVVLWLQRFAWVCARRQRLIKDVRGRAGDDRSRNEMRILGFPLISLTILLHFLKRSERAYADVSFTGNIAVENVVHTDIVGSIKCFSFDFLGGGFEILVVTGIRTVVLVLETCFGLGRFVNVVAGVQCWQSSYTTAIIGYLRCLSATLALGGWCAIFLGCSTGR